MNRWLLGLLCLVCCLSIGNALDCYVCTNQAGNVDKCLNTIATCEQNEDACMTEVRWGSAPYWTSGGQKQFYVSKRCMPKQQCDDIKATNMKYCSHLWYQDWKCMDCCVGDRCNYYIFSGGNSITLSFPMLLAAVFIPLLRVWVV